MIFREFLEIHASLLPAVNFAPGSTAFYDLIRLWNGLAVLFPEKCADVIVWEKGKMVSATKNDLDLNEIKLSLTSRKLENLPDNLRTNYNPNKVVRNQNKVETESKHVDDSGDRINQENTNKNVKVEKGDKKREKLSIKDFKEIDALADKIIEEIHVPSHVKEKPVIKTDL